MLFNLLLGFVILTIVSFMMIRPLTKTADAKNKAEYVISVNWPNENKDDIDTWLEDPTGKTVWFGQKEANLMHLDRDDLGNVNDFVSLADGSFAICPRNQELTTIRGFIPGEWILNIHAYSKRESKPTPVDVTIDRINPSLKTVFYKQIVMENQCWEMGILSI